MVGNHFWFLVILSSFPHSFIIIPILHSLSFYHFVCDSKEIIVWSRRRRLYLCQEKIQWILVEGCVTSFLLCFTLISGIQKKESINLIKNEIVVARRYLQQKVVNLKVMTFTLRWKHIIVVHFGQKNVFFKYILYYFGSNTSCISSCILRKCIKWIFDKKIFHTILVTLQMNVIFQQIFMFSHTYVCLTKKPHPNVFCEITWMKILK